MKSSLLALSFALVGFLAVSAQAQNVISVNIYKEVPMAPADLAGVGPARVANWNNLVVKGNEENLVNGAKNDAGNVVAGLVLSVLGGSTAGNTASFDQKKDPVHNDIALFNGGYDQDERFPMRIAASGIPFAKYDVYIYRITQEVNSDTRAGKITLGKAVFYIRGGAGEPKEDGSGYVLASGTSSTPIPQGNYVKFENVTGPNFTAECIAVPAGDEVQRCKIAGFQIVEHK
ncbi:MAG: hypothetical protein ACFUZC_16765 [Chthoniobacteraceae bacterium]